jgi:lysosomal Pro-X carboxypeptidase
MNVNFIGWGGSYGGMLGSWFRMRYPDALNGMIAGSAPILAFQGMSPPYDPSIYDILVTQDASPAGGSAPACVGNMERAWPKIESLSKTPEGRDILTRAFMTCAPLQSEEEALGLISWAQSPLGFMAMGSYPYPSDYMTHGDGKPMVAYPIRTGCEFLRNESLPLDDLSLLSGLRQFAAVYYNRTNMNADCFYNGKDMAEETYPRHYWPMKSYQGSRDKSSCSGTWDYQYCTEMVMPFASGVSGKDLFYPPSPWNLTATSEGCVTQFGVKPRASWGSVGFPGDRLFSDAAGFSRIIFTNGLLDPWNGGGVMQNISVERDLLAYVLPNGGHHLELMWAHPDDPPDAIGAREFIGNAIKRWIGFDER